MRIFGRYRFRGVCSSLPRCFLVTSGLLLLTVITGRALVSVPASADVIDEIGVIVPVSCSLLSDSANSYVTTIQNGVYQQPIGQTALKAICNDTDGFAIYATGFTGNEAKTENSNKLVGSNGIGSIATGTATSGNTSNWAMKLTATTGTYTPIIVGSTSDLEKVSTTPDFSNYTEVPNQFTRVAYRNSSTDSGSSAVGSTVTASYAIYISPLQPSGAYFGQVKYALVHPALGVTPPDRIVNRQVTVTYDANSGYYGDDTSVTTNTAVYDTACEARDKEYKISKTPNLDDSGNKDSSLMIDGGAWEDIITIGGAHKLKIVLDYDIVFNEGNPWVEDGYYSHYENGELLLCYGENTCNRYYGTGTRTIIVDGETVSMELWTSGDVTLASGHDYGYYALVYPLDENDEEYVFEELSSCSYNRVSGNYLEPHRYQHMFRGWGHASIDYSLGIYSEEDLMDRVLTLNQDNVTVYARWMY